MIAEFTLDGTEEIKRWIMSFGKHAQVLEPQELRDEIVGEWKEAVAEQDGRITHRKAAWPRRRLSDMNRAAN